MKQKEKTRKIVVDLAVTLDGFIEGPNGEVDWCIMDEEMNFHHFLNRIDTILYGRKSYELWGEYKPDANASMLEQEMWDSVHSKKKYVFSRSEQKDQNNVTYIRENIQEAMDELKNKPGKDIWLYGGSDLMKTFIQLGLVDEYRLSIHPILLGEGKPLFTDMKQRENLKLMETNTFSSGVVQLCYER